MWDGETLFSNEQALTAADSDGIVKVNGDIGGGEPVVLQVNTSGGATGGDLVIVMKTSSAASMAGAKEIARYTIEQEKAAAGGVVLAATVPTGCKKYLQLSYSGATGGNITAGLVLAAQTNK
ncbi:MAG: hypothetical protein LUC93_17700 [Planctomycetaceae bacterium]|nr:hypothetical protein [Planctomycetaceae bacterium]